MNATAAGLTLKAGRRGYMARYLFAALLMTGNLFALTAIASPADQDPRTARTADAATAGIRAAIELYFQGHATGDPSLMRDAFLPTAHIEGIRNGQFTSWTLDEYCARFNGKPAADEELRQRTIDLIDVSGDSAMAKATLRHGATVFTDYFVLLSVDGQWKIANKVYYGRLLEGAKE
jgi:hypothetical protein